MFALIIALIGWVVAGAPAVDDSLMLKIFIPTGGVSGTLFIIWLYTFKQNKKDFAKALVQNQEQFKFALDQNQKQFTYALEQNQKQFTYSLEQNQKQFEQSTKMLIEQYRENMKHNLDTINKLLGFIEQDGEYKETLVGVLTEMKNDMRQLISKVK